MFQSFKKENHARLMDRMADATGVNLGELTDSQWSGALERCCSCSNPGACEDWLESHPEGADNAPGFCRNGALMQRPEA